MKKSSRFLLCPHCVERCRALLVWLFQRAFSRRTFRFSVVGLASTFSYFLLGLLFVNFLAMPTLIGNGLAYLLSFAVSYLGQCLWTFEAKGSHGRMLPRFALVQLLGLVINSCIIGFCMRMGINYMISMLAAIFIVPIIVYFICKFWVFTQSGA